MHMKKSTVAAIAALTLMMGAASAHAGENDLGLKASGNAAGPGGDFKGRAETTGAGQSVGGAIATDSRASANPRSNNQDTGRVETPADTTIKLPATSLPH
jgi:hypothetical protein